MANILDGKKLAVIGDPIGHSLSPLIQQAMLDALGINCEYTAISVKGGTVASWLPQVTSLNLGGFNATMPHKTDLIPFMETLSKDAAMYRSVNTVVVRKGKFHGYNTDGNGFLRSLLDEDFDPAGKRIAVFGAGGAARSVVKKLHAVGAEHIVVFCRSPQKALALLDTGVDLADLMPRNLALYLQRADLFVNCTPLGMQGVEEDFNDFDFLDVLPENAPVYDVIYKPLKTTLLEEAENRGHKTINGLGMLIHQAILALEYFADTKLDPCAMKKAILKNLMPKLQPCMEPW